MNNKGPKRLPCGSPALILVILLFTPSITVFLLSIMKV